MMSDVSRGVGCTTERAAGAVPSSGRPLQTKDCDERTSNFFLFMGVLLSLMTLAGILLKVLDESIDIPLQQHMACDGAYAHIVGEESVFITSSWKEETAVTANDLPIDIHSASVDPNSYTIDMV